MKLISVNCVWQDWASATVSTCSKKCSVGLRNITRIIETDAFHSGVECHEVQCTNDTKNCEFKTELCNVDTKCQGIYSMPIVTYGVIYSYKDSKLNCKQSNSFIDLGLLVGMPCGVLVVLIIFSIGLMVFIKTKKKKDLNTDKGKNGRFKDKCVNTKFI